MTPPPSVAEELLRAHLLARVPITDEEFAFLQQHLRPLSLAKRQHYLRAGTFAPTWRS